MKKTLPYTILLALIIVFGYFNLTRALVIVSPGPTIGSINYLQTGTTNQFYSQSIQVSGGVSPYVWTIASGDLPAGLSLNAASGTISGVPTTAATFSFRVSVTDFNSEVDSKDFVLVISPNAATGFSFSRTPIGDTVISPITVRVRGVFGVDFCTDPRSGAYDLQFGGLGDGIYAYSQVMLHAQGDLVDDIFQVPLSSGLYTGVQMLCDHNTYGHFTINNIALTIVPAIPTITTAPYLPTGSINQPYVNQLGLDGGLPPYTWGITSGNLPPGLSINSQSGEISGTPTSMGTFNFSAQVIDGNNTSSAINNFTLVIGQQSTTGFIYTRTPPGGIVVTPFTVRIQGVFGVDFCTDARSTSYDLQFGGLGSGRSGSSPIFEHIQGEVVDDTFQVDLGLGDYTGTQMLCNHNTYGHFVINRDFFSVVAPSPTITTLSQLTTGMVNRTYSSELIVSGGLPPYNWNVVSGELPSGLSLGLLSGTISGTPSSAGTFNFSIQVTDSNSVVGMKDFTVTIAQESSTEFVVTRIPTGDIVTSPITVRVRGVFGYNFCNDPRIGAYRIEYEGSGGNHLSSSIPHSQGDIVDDSIQINLTPGTYVNNELFCGVNDLTLIYPIDTGLTVPIIVISSTNLQDGLVGAGYSQFINSVGGTTPLAWSVISGALPTGLMLNNSTGEISGTPIMVENANFTVQVIDANNNIATKDLSITVHGNTPTGNPVVGPISGVTLTFAGGVTQEGQTTVTTSSNGPPPPSGFKLGNPPTYYSISTIAQYNPPIEVCISWAEDKFNNENNLKLSHFENGQWVNTTTSLDTTNNVICGQVSSFSEFALFESLDIDYLIYEVKSFNLEQDIESGLLDKLNAAKSAIERSQKKTATNNLKAFINQVKGQTDKKITTEQSTILLVDSNFLIGQYQGNSVTAFFRFIFVDIWVNLFGAIVYLFK